VLLAIAVLGVIGLRVEDSLKPGSLLIPGTNSARGQALAEEHFGDSSPFAILLSGPDAAIERQGPRLVESLRRDPATTAISPWDPTAVPGLRPDRRHALILVDFHVDLDEAMRHTVPALDRLLESQVQPPLRAIQSGYASISAAVQSDSLAATERAELIAGPLLLIILLLVFRSVVAAAIPLLFGAMTVVAGRGVLVLLSSHMEIDAISLVVCTMMGLALGIDYSLLIVSRFREELRAGLAPREAALATRGTAGRTTVFAGSTLFVSILASAFVQPGPLLVSLAVSLVVVIAISVTIAWVALPALLALLGERIDAWRIGARPSSKGSRSRVASAAALALKRPAIAVVLITIPLVLLTIPALAFNTGSPGVDELPGDSEARLNSEAIAAAAGPGWNAPFVLVAATGEGPITSEDRLALLARWQRRIAARSDVEAVIGPGRISRSVQSLAGLEDGLTSGRAAELARLGPAFERASGAVARLRSGIGRAAAGSELLGQGSARAERGAGLLAAGLDRAGSGGERASSAIGRLAEGSERLAAGQRTAGVAGSSLALGLRSLLPGVRKDNLARARQLAAELEATAEADPTLRPAANRARVLAGAIAFTRDEVRRLREVAIKLNGGLDRLASGGEKLRDGSRQLAAKAAGLSVGLERLGGGAEALRDGLGALRGGNEALSGGLGEGFRRSHPLQVRLRRAGGRVSATTAPLLRDVRRLRRDSPRLLDSGFLVLSAIDGARRVQRAQGREAISLDDGGQAARMLVVAKSGLNSEGARVLGADLLADAERIAGEGELRTAVGGGAAILNDYGTATKSRLPLVIGAIIAITFLMLVAILRAPLLALLTVGLNLASVAAAIGVMSLICKIPAGYPLGGHPYIDTVGAAAIFGVTFGLSIDYAVFLIVRMRDSWERDRDNAAAIAFGLEKTAGVITGAAAIMAAVFVSFAAAPIATVSQMGVGLTVAILLDATVVRIVLLPALMLLFGDRVWAVPAWLDRLLPELNVHGTEANA
jgi:RND superfamily putative drug exporter